MPDTTPTLSDISFSSEGETLRGHLFLPAGASADLPLIIVTGSWTTVKEQMPDLYARRLAEQGFAALTFDFRFWGQSSGAPRQFEAPAEKTKDIRSAIDFAATLPMVDPQRIGALAVCASSGYLAHALNGEDRVKAVAFIAPWLHNPDLVGSIYGGDEGVKQRLKAGRAAHEKYASSGEVEYVPAASASDQSAAMAGPFPYYLDPARGAIPEWDNRFAVMSWVEWLSYDAIAAAPGIKIPVLMVHSEKAAVPAGAKAFYAALSAPKDILWTEGVQFDFYDQEPQVSKAVAAAATHFNLNL